MTRAQDDHTQLAGGARRAGLDDPQKYLCSAAASVLSIRAGRGFRGSDYELLDQKPGASQARSVEDGDFHYELRNNSAVYRKYQALVEVYKANIKNLKPLLPMDYFDMAEEVEYLEKVREVYQQVYDL